MNPSPETLNAILRDIVTRWPYSKCTQLDTYVMNDSSSKFNDTNFGMGYNDYKAGYFWSRAWVNGGANRDNLAGKFPALAHQSFSTEPDEDTETNNYTQTGSILVIDQYDCEDCGECNRTQWEVSKDTKSILMSVMALLKEYKLWDVVDSEDTEYQLWAVPSVIAAMQDSGDIVSANEAGELITSLSFSSDVTEWAVNLVPKTIGWFVNYRLEYCFNNSIVLNADLPENAVIGALRCENC